MDNEEQGPTRDTADFRIKKAQVGYFKRDSRSCTAKAYSLSPGPQFLHCILIYFDEFKYHSVSKKCCRSKDSSIASKML